MLICQLYQFYVSVALHEIFEATAPHVSTLVHWHSLHPCTTLQKELRAAKPRRGIQRNYKN